MQVDITKENMKKHPSYFYEKSKQNFITNKRLIIANTQCTIILKE